MRKIKIFFFYPLIILFAISKTSFSEELDKKSDSSNFKKHSLVMNYDFQNYFSNNSIYKSDQNSIKSYKSPWLAFFLSAIFPGLGQLYNGDYIKAVIQPILFAGGVYLASSICFDCSSGSEQSAALIGLGLAIGTYIWSIIDAPVSANLYNDQQLKLSSTTSNNKLFSTTKRNLYRNNNPIFSLKINF